MELVDASMQDAISEKSRKRLGFLMVFGACFLGWSFLFVVGLMGYTGSKWMYAAFSIIFGVLLITGFHQKGSYGYLFLTVFLWLGFWLKFTLHTVLSYPFVEPVGTFVGGGDAWDDVLGVATVAALGVMAANGLFQLISRFRGKPHSNAAAELVPQWYPHFRKWLWGAVILLVVGVAFLNLSLGIQQIGLAPRTILMWPMNAVISWLLNMGMATAVAVLLWWDIALKRSVSVSVYAILTEAFLSSVSIMSRAVYVFHSLPQLFVLIRSRSRLQNWTVLKTLMIAVMFVVSLVFSIAAVTTFRNYLYQSDYYVSTAYQEAYNRLEVIEGTIATLEKELETASPENRIVLMARLRELRLEREKFRRTLVAEKEKIREAMSSGFSQSKILLNEFGYQISGGVAARILQLVADRWIGLEGVMAVQAYPDKRMDLFWHALSGSQEIGKPDTYQVISNSIYLKAGDAKFRFRTLPGAVAFLYYSNSLYVVFLGMLLFTCLIVLVESVIGVLTRNPIICSLYGAEVASNVAQFGGTPRQNISYFLMLACGILLVWLVNAKVFALVLQKLKIYNASVASEC